MPIRHGFRTLLALIAIVILTVTQPAAATTRHAAGSVPPPEASPQQAVLGDALSSFLASGNGYDTATAYLTKTSGTSAFNDGGCLAALKAYHAAVDQQKALQMALDAWQTSYKAMSQNENALVGLIATRSALVTAQAGAFTASVKVLEGLQGIVPGTVISSVNYLAGEIGIVASAHYDQSPPDNWDQALNSTSVVLGSLGAFQAKHPDLPITAANALAVLASSAKAIYDAAQDLKAYLKNADNTELSYLQAGTHYHDNLKAMKSSVAAMTTAMKDCPPAKTDCGGAHNGKHVGTHAACKAAAATSK